MQDAVHEQLGRLLDFDMLGGNDSPSGGVNASGVGEWQLDLSDIEGLPIGEVRGVSCASFVCIVCPWHVFHLSCLIHDFYLTLMNCIICANVTSASGWPSDMSFVAKCKWPMPRKPPDEVSNASTYTK